MKNTKQLLMITSLAAGITLSAKSSVYAKQLANSNLSNPKTYNYNEYSSSVINLNYKGAIVKHIQSTLNLHFAAGLAEDEIYGLATKDAVKDMQKKLGICADGVFGPTTAKALLNYIENNSVDDKNGFSPIPIDIQKNLISLGYKINVNGDLCSYDTVLAIKDFQRQNSLPVTGKANIQLLNKLNEKLKIEIDGTSKFQSNTNYYIAVNSSDHICRVYEKINGSWKEFKCFDILSGKIDKGVYTSGIQGKEVNFNGVAMKNFTQIDGLHVFYSAEKDTGHGLKISNESAKFLSTMPPKTTIKIF